MPAGPKCRTLWALRRRPLATQNAPAPSGSPARVHAEGAGPGFGPTPPGAVCMVSKCAQSGTKGIGGDLKTEELFLSFQN
jgi:hypothetical protein